MQCLLCPDECLCTSCFCQIPNFDCVVVAGACQGVGIKPADCCYRTGVSFDSVCVQVAVVKSQILIVWSSLALARVWASSLQTVRTTLVCPSSVFCTVKVSWERGGRGERGEGGWGFPPVLKVAPRRFHGFWDKKDSNILALDFPARPLHKRAPHRDGQRSSFILLNSFPKVLSSYLHSSFSSTSSAPPGTSASNAWLKHFKHAIARLLGRRKSLKMSDTFSPSGPILLPLKDICRSFCCLAISANT